MIKNLAFKLKENYLNLDKEFLFIIFLLIIIGIIIQFDIGTSIGSHFRMRGFITQIFALGLGLSISLFIYLKKNVIDFLYKYSYLFWIIAIILLSCVLLFGKTINGSKRWLNFGFMSFQPSVLAHPALIICFAKAFSKTQNNIKDLGILKFFKNYMTLIIITISIVALILFG
jgi:cell division protein FtsW (lipid II flippase)